MDSWTHPVFTGTDNITVVEEEIAQYNSLDFMTDEQKEFLQELQEIKEHLEMSDEEKGAKKKDCGDDVSAAIKDATHVKSKQSGKVEASPFALAKVAKQNGIDLEARWGHLNGGMQRMNLGSVLRAAVKRGDKVTIGKKVFNKDGVKFDPNKKPKRVRKSTAAKPADKKDPVKKVVKKQRPAAKVKVIKKKRKVVDTKAPAKKEGRKKVSL